MSIRSPLDLLEPGRLLGGALFRSLGDPLRPGRALAVGERVGAWEIVAEIGQGGMGRVYRARRADGAFDQHVALKCIDSAGARGIELFRRERQYLADLRHPNVARLLDGGETADGRPWFAMELVDGAPIDRHVQATAPDLATRVALFLGVADAVRAAHERLLVHRDIKPANVLVDADGAVKLLDFGIAALADDVQAAAAYSPGWASPEQLAGAPVGPASDQYQLGLLLARVFDAPDAAVGSDTATRAETSVIAASGRARKPDPRGWIALPARRRGELVAIVERACAAEPGARYGSVAELAGDVVRWRDGLPVQAWGNGLGYTLTSAIRRRPWTSAAVATTAVAVVTLVTGFSLRLAEQRALAQAAAARAETEAATALAINRFLNDDILGAADPYGESRAATPAAELLALALPRVDERFPDDPAVAGALHLTIGRSLRNLGQPEAAMAPLDRAIEQLAVAHGASDPRVFEARMERAIADDIAQRVDAYGERLAALANDAAGLPADDLVRLRIDGARAWQAFTSGDFARAVALAEPLLATVTADTDERRREIGDIHLTRGLAYMRLGRAADALPDFERTHALRLGLRGPDHPDVWLAESQMANALLALGQGDRALAILETNFARLRGRFGDIHNQTIGAAHELGLAYLRADRAADAIAPLEAAVAGKTARFGALDGPTVTSAAVLGAALTRLERYDEAERLFAGLAAFAPETPYDQRTASIVLRNRGDLALLRGRPREAAQYCEASLRIVNALGSLGETLRETVEPCVGFAAAANGEVERARALLQPNVERLRAAGPQAARLLARVEAALAALPRAEASETADATPDPRAPRP
jgi:serine/threonine-protein kinase